MYNVYQHWDPLKSCAVGISYPPNVYDYIKNEKVRSVFYRIAEETEEDYQQLISLLQKFNVEVIRPEINENVDLAIYNGKNKIAIEHPYFMVPRDFSLMLGETFFVDEHRAFSNIATHVRNQGNTIIESEAVKLRNASNSRPLVLLNGSMTSRIGKDIYIGTRPYYGSYNETAKDDIQKIIGDAYRIHVIDTYGHVDGTFCPVIPGLILSIDTPITYKNTFPDWEIVYLPNESWHKVKNFMYLKQQNAGKWWIPGEELNNDLINYVETWMKDWVGYVEESVFDVNMLVIDKQNVIVNGYNEKVFDALNKRGITPHICNFRHRYFWDGGLHCITSDLHREGVMEDYFPERNQ